MTFLIFLAILLFNAPVFAQRTGCEQVRDGIRNARCFPGANAGAKIAAAIADLPSTGGKVDACGFEGAQTFTATLVLNKPVELIVCKATFTMTGGPTELIKVASPGASITGSGQDSIFEVGSRVANTVDAIRIVGTEAMPGIRLRNFTIRAQSGTPGRYPIHVDATNFTLEVLTIDNVNVGPLGGTAGIYATGPIGTEGYGGLTIQNCYSIANGIRLTRAGDTVRIIANRICDAYCYSSQSAVGIDVDFVPGASTIIIKENNVTTRGGDVRLRHAAVSARIIYNEFETPAGATGSNGAMIDVEGTQARPTLHTLIQGNSFQVANGSSVASVRVNYANDTDIHGNYFGRGTFPAKDIVVTDKALDTKIGVNRYEDRALANILTDAGTHTVVTAP